MAMKLGTASSTSKHTAMSITGLRPIRSEMKPLNEQANTPHSPIAHAYGQHVPQSQIGPLRPLADLQSAS
jgi:hypothetical protein